MVRSKSALVAPCRWAIAVIWMISAACSRHHVSAQYFLWGCHNQLEQQPGETPGRARPGFIGPEAGPVPLTAIGAWRSTPASYSGQPTKKLRVWEKTAEATRS